MSESKEINNKPWLAITLAVIALVGSVLGGALGVYVGDHLKQETRLNAALNEYSERMTAAIRYGEDIDFDAHYNAAQNAFVNASAPLDDPNKYLNFYYENECIAEAILYSKKEAVDSSMPLMQAAEKAADKKGSRKWKLGDITLDKFKEFSKEKRHAEITLAIFNFRKSLAKAIGARH